MKSVIEATDKTSSCKASNILCIIPCEGSQKDTIYYESKHVGSKMTMTNSSVDSIELYFTDKWGQALYGMTDFMVELTFDFVKFGNFIPNITAKDIKNMYRQLPYV
jgi:hypothetical protein